MKALQMQSCVHENATVECALVEITLPDPGPEEVLVAVEAAPINPSDLGLMFVSMPFCITVILLAL